jgi:hypothetical protein
MRVIEKADIAQLKPLLCSIDAGKTIIGRGTQAIYDLIGAGEIRAVKSDGRTLLVVESLYEYVDSLQAAKVAPPRRRKPQRMRAEIDA